MKISNWERAKKQAILKLPVCTIGAAFLFFGATLVAFWNGPINYREQVKQLDWTVTNATVSYVYEYYDAFHFKGSGSGATVYDTPAENVEPCTEGVSGSETVPRRSYGGA